MGTPSSPGAVPRPARRGDALQAGYQTQGYSYRNVSIGSERYALPAGQRPRSASAVVLRGVVASRLRKNLCRSPAKTFHFSIGGSINGTRRQVEVHRQAETPGRAHRGGLREPRHSQVGGEASGLGNRQQGNRRRQEERLRPRQENEHCAVAQGRSVRRRGVVGPARRGPVGVGAEGRRDTQGPRPLTSYRPKGTGSRIPRALGRSETLPSSRHFSI